MTQTNFLFNAIGIKEHDKSLLLSFSRSTNIPIERLKYYNDRNILPTGTDLIRICSKAGISSIQLMLVMGHFDHNIRTQIKDHAKDIYGLIEKEVCKKVTKDNKPKLVYKTKLGKLYQGDCLSLMKTLDDESIDLIFADPPFNLQKIYPSRINDKLKEEQYIQWCEDWLAECIRILRHGGSLFLWNLPKWNTYLSAYLNGRLTFRHWISVDIKYSLPMPGRLYPSHYSLLYYCKGEKPKVFHPDRLPMQVCKKCHCEIKDYGGYKNKMNPSGINLSDVWYDISPVRHSKFKQRGANELSIQLMDRIIEMASDKDDLVFDPFGGSGTTYAIAEIKKRRWLGVELGPTDEIIERFSRLEEEKKRLDEQRTKLNNLFNEEILKKRLEKGLWTAETETIRIRLKKVARK